MASSNTGVIDDKPKEVNNKRQYDEIVDNNDIQENGNGPFKKQMTEQSCSTTTKDVATQTDEGSPIFYDASDSPQYNSIEPGYTYIFKSFYESDS